MQFKVDPPELHSTAGIISGLADAYEVEYQTLLNHASTMGSAWEAQDNQYFVTQINGFLDDLKAMTAHLRQASEVLKRQAGLYEQNRNDNITKVQQLAN